MTTAQATTVVRQLPLRIAPAPGEAIDSWLDALAYRCDVPWAELRRALGSVLPAMTSYQYQWILRLTDTQAAVISAATGVDPGALHAMTLAAYPAIAVGIDPDTAQAAAKFPWRHVYASRFCPSCLAANGGRWKLAWRMVWFFACPIHSCLLADHCPECAGAQRGRSIAAVVPQPGRCTCRATGDEATSVPPLCDADLTAARVTWLDRRHPVLAAQATITEAIIENKTSVGIYRGMSYPVAQVLTDIVILGRYFLRDADPQILSALVSPDIVAEYLGLPAPAHRPDRRPPDRASPAAGTAVAVTAAMAILGRDDVASAARVLRTAWPAGDNRFLFARFTRGSHEEASTALRGVHLAALAPELGTTDQLRCRIGTSLPRYPVYDSTDAQLMARRIPSVFWPQWSVRLAGSQHSQRTLCQALAAALLVVATGAKIPDALTLLNCPLSVQTINFTLAKLRHAERWNDVRHALYRLSDHLRRSAPPIDYQRRRRLKYTQLLPEPTWKAICRSTHTRPEGIATARQYMFERLSSTFATPSPIAKADKAANVSLFRFPLRLTPELAAALTTYSLEYLAAHGITDEPDQWNPPIELLAGLSLPSTGTDGVALSLLHQAIRHDGLPMAEAAHRLETTTDIVRVALDQHPAPRLPRRPTRVPLTVPRAGPAYQKASSMLTPERFAELYDTDGRSLRDIAALCGVSRQSVGQLARDYGIRLRPSGWRRNDLVDPAWLYHQLMDRQRSLRELAGETGIPLTALANRAQIYGIPVRRMSRYSAAALTADERVPRILIPALARQGGWERLQRLSVIARFASLSAAAVQLKSHNAGLGCQIRLIERDLGGAVLIRATDKQPQRLTDLGNRAVAAVNDLAAHGGTPNSDWC